MRGIFTFDLESGKVGFKFGTYALSIACEKDGCGLNEFFNRCGFNKTGEVKLSSLLNLWYGAAVHYCHHLNKEVDFNSSHVSDWLDEIGLDKVKETYVEGLKQFVPKNSKAPVETGQTTTV
jgi:hypothetical protein